MEKKIPLEYGKYYHIFNRGINSCDIFFENANYEHFLKLYSEYIEPVAETFAWVLLKNHFHFLVRIKEESEIDFIKPKENKKHIIYEQRKKYKPENQFGHLFNAYAKAVNNRFDRTGSLFENSFERIWVYNQQYFCNLISYIHNNPVKHRFCGHPLEYPWSSYVTMISVKPTRLSREKVLGWFNSKNEFVLYHNNLPDENLIREFIVDI